MYICVCIKGAESVQSRPSLLWPQSQSTADLYTLAVQVFFPTRADILWSTVMNPLNLTRAFSCISNTAADGRQTAGREKEEYLCAVYQCSVPGNWLFDWFD